MSVRVHKTLAVLLLSGIAGCASGPFHRKTVPPPALQPQPPELSQTPLYSPEMSENNPRTPSLPAPQTAVVVVKQPEPAPVKPHKPRKTKPQPAAPARPPTADAEVASNSPSPASNQGSTPAPPAPPAPAPAAEKRPQEAQQAKAAKPGPSPIGELTTGDSAQVAQTSHQASELIRLTREGMESIKRTLSSEEKKTMVEIGTFLTRADQALKNGDVDGAYGLATKAKILLDELTQN